MKLEDVIGENFTVSDLAEKSGKTVEEIMLYAFAKPVATPRTQGVVISLTAEKVFNLLKNGEATSRMLSVELNLAEPTVRRIISELTRAGRITKLKSRPASYKAAT